MASWFVTGVSSGLGRALAVAALERDHTVAGTVRTAEAGRAFAELNPNHAHPLLLDVTDEAAVQRAVAEAESLTGGLDYVVNNAGHGFTGAVEETSIADAKALFDVNLFGPMAVIKAALPYMRARRRGHIVNITSVSGLATWHGTAIYGASKFALECLGRTLAQEVAPLGIHVTNVAPGGLRTEFATSRLPGAAPVIDDYAGTAHLARATLLDHHGSEPSDPSRAAEAILGALAAAHPPLLLLLGADALSYAEHEFAVLKKEIGRWQPLTLSIAADDEEIAMA